MYPLCSEAQAFLSIAQWRFSRVDKDNRFASIFATKGSRLESFLEKNAIILIIAISRKTTDCSNSHKNRKAFSLVQKFFADICFLLLRKKNLPTVRKIVQVFENIHVFHLSRMFVRKRDLLALKKYLEELNGQYF
jgi:hypothetical protein